MGGDFSGNKIKTKGDGSKDLVLETGLSTSIIELSSNKVKVIKDLDIGENAYVNDLKLKFINQNDSTIEYNLYDLLGPPKEIVIDGSSNT